MMRRRYRATAATSRPARAPINRSAHRIAPISPSMVHGAFVARRLNSVPPAARGMNRNAEPGPGARIHAKGIEGRDGESMRKTTTTWTTRSCSAGAAAGRRSYLVYHHRPDRFAFVHEVEGVVDLVERHCVGDQIVDIDFTLHVPVDDLGHVRAAARAAECGSAPDASGHELEWTS